MTKYLIGRSWALNQWPIVAFSMWSRSGFRHPSRETEGDFYVIRTRDWVNVIPITSNFEMVLVNQYRFGVQKNSGKFPAALWNPEKILSSRVCESCRKRRDLAERARLLGSVRPNPAIQNNACHIVLAEKASKTADLQWTSMKRSQPKLCQSNAFLIWFSPARSFTRYVECPPAFLPGVGKDPGSTSKSMRDTRKAHLQTTQGSMAISPYSKYRLRLSFHSQVAF